MHRKSETKALTSLEPIGRLPPLVKKTAESPLVELHAEALPQARKADMPLQLAELPPPPSARTLRYLFKQLTLPDERRETGLQHLSTTDFMLVKRATGAFSHAGDSGFELDGLRNT